MVLILDPTSIEFIRVDSKVAVGDTVLSSGVCIDLNNCPYPANYPVGIVSEVLRVPEIVDLVVKVELSDKAKKLGKIYVLRSNTPSCYNQPSFEYKYR